MKFYISPFQSFHGPESPENLACILKSVLFQKFQHFIVQVSQLLCQIVFLQHLQRRIGFRVSEVCRVQIILQTKLQTVFLNQDKEDVFYGFGFGFFLAFGKAAAEKGVDLWIFGEVESQIAHEGFGAVGWGSHRKFHFAIGFGNLHPSVEFSKIACFPSLNQSLSFLIQSGTLVEILVRVVVWFI